MLTSKVHPGLLSHLVAVEAEPINLGHLLYERAFRVGVRDVEGEVAPSFCPLKSMVSSSVLKVLRAHCCRLPPVVARPPL